MRCAVALHTVHHMASSPHSDHRACVPMAAGTQVLHLQYAQEGVCAMVSIGLLNELIRVEEALDGTYVTLPPVGDARVHVAGGTRYTVVEAQQPNGTWRAIVPLLGQSGEGKTQAEAEQALIASLHAFLMRRAHFIHEAAPLVERLVVDNPEETVVYSADRSTMAPVWQVFDAMGKILPHRVIGVDDRMMEPKQIAAVADLLGLPVDAVRAAIAYSLEHQGQIRRQHAAAALTRVNGAFARLEAESGLSEDDLLTAADNRSASP